jgi:ribosomal protein S14
MALFRIYRIDQYKRLSFILSQKKKKLYKFYKNNFVFPYLYYYIKYNKYTFNYFESISKYKNKCLLSGKFNSVYKPFKMSRMIFNYMASASWIRGIIKY